MPTVAVYVPAALYREIETLAPTNGYESADDYVRALALATLDELTTGVAMSREVKVDTPASVAVKAKQARAVLLAAEEHFKPDPKPEKKK